MRRALPLAAVLLAVAPAAARAAIPAAFGARSYAPGQSALLHVQGPPRRLTLQIFASGPGSDGLGLAAVDDPRPVRGGVVAVRMWNWPSGVYFARLQGGGQVGYAPFILRARTLGTHRVAVVEPTNTWQAYNNFDGQSWYFEGGDTVGLSRPYLDGGVPPHFRGYDLGFLRWLVRTQKQVDFLADDDLERIDSATRLHALYDLIVFPGHEEYVTPHAYDLVKRYRDAGGNLMFLSADNFYYRVLRGRDTITRSGRWRDLGRPEAALVGVQYVDWNERTFPNRPYSVVDGGSWAFAGTHLRTGSTFGRYGIEIDATAPQSPPGTHVLAEIPDAFGPGQSAQMTYYELGAAKVFAAGVLNLGGSADWPVVSRIVENVWERLTAD